MKYKYAIIDIETSGLSRYKENINFIGIGLSEEVMEPITKYYFFDTSKDNHEEKFFEVYNKLQKNKIKTVFQNGKFDSLFIEHHYGLKIPIIHDVMLLGTAYDLAAEHSLKKMAKNYLGVEDWDISKKDKTSTDFSKVKPYLKKDLDYTWHLLCYFFKHMTEEQFKIYEKLLKPAYLMYRDVERNGIYVDTKSLKSVIKKYKEDEVEKLKVLNSRYNINWNSPKQVQEVLFEKEGLPVLKKSEKTNAPSAGVDVLKRLAVDGYELPKQLLEYRSSNTLNKMFLNRWEGDCYEGRIHPNFNLTNVVSGRTSCSDPNLQQVPRTKDVRAIFTAPKKRLFFEADYSQLELRIAADYANEPTMLRIYREKGDIHTETAKTLTSGREPTKEDRSKAKAINFGFLYGMSARGFIDYAFNSYGVVFTLAEAKHYRELFFAKYSRLLPWHKEQEQLCELLGGVSNKFGRFRKLPDIYHSNNFYRSGAVRRAINTPVQGTGSDILVGAAVQVHKTLTKEGVKVVGTVHDSILGEFWEGDEDWVVPEIKKIMARPKIMDVFGVELKVELEADVGVGPWGAK